jgi:predicted dehydrogenase
VRVGILGSGFGLYGYLPAVVRLGATPVLPERYRDKLRGRDDVARFEDQVLWAADDEALLARAEAIVLAIRPADQVARARQTLETPRISRLLLEKPLAPDPAAARALLDTLGAAGRTVRAGFTFRHTPWAARVKDWIGAAGPEQRLRIDWRFHAHHYRTDLETWKRRPSLGGGALRFFGIHIVALLAELGYRATVESTLRGEGPDDARAWQATFTGPGLPGCATVVESDASAAHFVVEGTAGTGVAPLRIDIDDPFAESESEGPLDRRLGVLQPLCRDWLSGPAGIPAWYAASVDLWEAAEARAEAG